MYDRTIVQDLQRCCLALGMTEQALHRSKPSMREVSRRANVFLQDIAPFLPRSFSESYKNPCWVATKPSVYPGWEDMLFAYFRNQDGRRLRKRIKKEGFLRFLSKPVEEEYTKSRRLVCLPYFFLAGFPKCATTTVHDAIGTHKDIMQSSEKEPHFWPRNIDAKSFSVEYASITFMTYTLYFKNLSRLLAAPPNSTVRPLGFITYDSSQSTLWDSNFFYKGQEYCAMPAVISRVLPNAKFIIVMRNPVTRLYSHFLYSCLVHYGKVSNWPTPVRANTASIFHAQVTKEIADFHNCTEYLSTFECVSLWIAQRTSKASIEGSEFNCGRILHRLVIGLYSVHIRKWLQFYPRENFLFIRTEDISSNSTELVSQITEFLGISPVSEEMARDMFKKENVFNASAQYPMEERTRLMLENFYRPYNEKLAAITRDDRYLWKDF